MKNPKSYFIQAIYENGETGKNYITFIDKLHNSFTNSAFISSDNLMTQQRAIMMINDLEDNNRGQVDEEYEAYTYRLWIRTPQGDIDELEHIYKERVKAGKENGNE